MPAFWNFLNFLSITGFREVGEEILEFFEHCSVLWP